MSRSLISQRIRGATDSPPGPLPDLPSFPAEANPAVRFAAELERAGGVFFDGRKGRVMESLTEIISQSGAEEILWETWGIFEKHQIPCRLRDPQAFAAGHLVFSGHRAGNLENPLVLHSRPFHRGRLAEAKLTASSAVFGVAETGTVVHRMSQAGHRLFSILPPSQLFLLSAGDLLANHLQLFQQPDLLEGGSLITLVTGPSRTADIEKSLVIGVHGPLQLFVLLTD